MRDLNTNRAELRSATRRRHSLKGHLNRFVNPLYGAHWTRNAVWFDLNTRAIDLNASAFDLNAVAFVRSSLAPRRYSLQFRLAG